MYDETSKKDGTKSKLYCFKCRMCKHNLVNKTETGCGFCDQPVYDKLCKEDKDPYNFKEDEECPEYVNVYGEITVGMVDAARKSKEKWTTIINKMTDPCGFCELHEDEGWDCRIENTVCKCGGYGPTIHHKLSSGVRLMLRYFGTIIGKEYTTREEVKKEIADYLKGEDTTDLKKEMEEIKTRMKNQADSIVDYQNDDKETDEEIRQLNASLLSKSIVIRGYQEREREHRDKTTVLKERLNCIIRHIKRANEGAGYDSQMGYIKEDVEILRVKFGIEEK